MTVEYVRYRIPVEKAARFEADYREAVPFLQASAFCLGCELTKCEEEADRYILRIEWTSMQDHLQGFRTSEAFQGFLPHVREWIDHLEEMQHYQPLGIGFSQA